MSISDGSTQAIRAAARDCLRCLGAWTRLAHSDPKERIKSGPLFPSKATMLPPVCRSDLTTIVPHAHCGTVLVVRTSADEHQIRAREYDAALPCEGWL